MQAFILAKDKDSGKIKEISEVKGGLSCHCICPNCDGDLIAVQGEKTDWYFRHHQNTDCQDGAEMGLKELAKEVLSSASHIVLPEMGKISLQTSAFNHATLDPDWTGLSDGKEFYFFISILKDDDPAKQESFSENLVEIDLRNYVFQSREEFQNDLLKDISLKKIISRKKSSSKPASLAAVLLGTGVLLGAYIIRENFNKNEQAKDSSGFFSKVGEVIHDSDILNRSLDFLKEGKEQSKKTLIRLYQKLSFEK